MNLRSRLFVPAVLLTLLAIGCQPESTGTESSIEVPELRDLAAAEGPTVEQDIAAIRALQDRWNAAVEAGNTDGYIAVLDDNIELLPINAPPINGTEGYRAMLDGVFSANTFDIEAVDRGTIEVAGDIGWARYDYIVHRTPKATGDGSEPVTVSSLGRYIDIMRRQDDGSWRVYKHIWNYSEPGVVP